jgi:cell division protease FtsH
MADGNAPQQPNGKGPKGKLSGLFMAAAIGIPLLVTLNIMNRQETAAKDTAVSVPYSVFEDKVSSKEIDGVVIQGSTVTGFDKEVTPGIPDFKAVIPPQAAGDIYRQLRDHNPEVEVDFKPEPKPNAFLSFLMIMAPTLLIMGVLVFMMRRASGMSGMSAITGSKAKLANGELTKIKFSDVAGADEAKEQVQEIVKFLKDPSKFGKTGGVMPKGALLVGPPGTGKTLLAKAVAGEANRPFFSMSGSEFVEMFVGVGASRVRSLFEQAKANAPCIIFIDEIDAVGQKRGKGGSMGGHDEREQTLNQLLVEMDGFDSNAGVFIIAATNRPDVLDPALLRPGRLTRQITVDVPDLKGREQILMVHAKNKPLKPDVNLLQIARETSGMVGADLANMINEAALLAANADRDQIGMEDLREAIDKVIMGPELKSKVLTPATKGRVAYHEAGHALMSLFVPGNDPLVKVNVQPRGKALGVTWSAPEEDQFLLTEDELKARLVMLYGGRTAEEIIYGEGKVTTGASNDIERASDLARKMVTQFGMSDKLGRVNYSDEKSAQRFTREFSEASAQLIDEEVRRITDQAYAHAKEVLQTHMQDLVILKDALVAKESLTAEEVKALPGFGPKLPLPANDAGPLPLPRQTGTDGPSGP